MNEETPTEHFYKTTFHVRESFIAPFRSPEDAAKAFDVWLAGVQKAAWDEGAHHGASFRCEFAKDVDDRCPENPYRGEQA